MKAYAQPIKRLISELGKLPGIGEKTAARLANYILRATADDVKKLAESIIEVKRKNQTLPDLFKPDRGRCLLYLSRYNKGSRRYLRCGRAGCHGGN
jgi:recombination protein RecR